MKCCRHSGFYFASLKSEICSIIQLTWLNSNSKFSLFCIETGAENHVQYFSLLDAGCSLQTPLGFPLNMSALVYSLGPG